MAKAKKKTKTKTKKETRYEKLGRLTYRIGEKMEAMRKLDADIKSLQVESNNVATEIEESNGK
jgi:hypothetical protein